jgi:CheY-like chemotaxis protein
MTKRARSVVAAATSAEMPGFIKPQLATLKAKAPTVRMLMREVLEEASYIALDAGDEPSGLKILRPDARSDLLVTDVGLLGGMNGRQVADAAREPI